MLRSRFQDRSRASQGSRVMSCCRPSPLRSLIDPLKETLIDPLKEPLKIFPMHLKYVPKPKPPKPKVWLECVSDPGMAGIKQELKTKVWLEELGAWS